VYIGMRLWIAARVLGALVIAMPLAQPAQAITPDRHLSQYGHRSWRFEDNLVTWKPPDALAQTADGYIWVAGESGVWRFDGVRFTRAFSGAESLPSNRVSKLVAARDGSLWIGTAHGLARFLRGHLTVYPDIPEYISSLTEAPDGAIWYGFFGTSPLAEHRDKSLCRLAGEHPRCFGQADGLRTGEFQTIRVLKSGEVWLGSDLLLQRWTEGSASTVYEFPNLEQNAGQIGITGIEPDGDGSILVSKCSNVPGPRIVRVVNGTAVDYRARNLDLKDNCGRLYRDRAGALWLATIEDGLYRIYGGTAEHFGTADGLSGAQVAAIFEDREGTLWVATNNGLDSFYDTRVVRFTRSQGITSEEVDGVQTSHGGAVYIGTALGLDVLDTNNDSISIDSKLGRSQIAAILEDDAGRLWVSVDEDLYVENPGGQHKVSRIRGPDGQSLGMIFQLTEDGAGDLWGNSQKGSNRQLIWIQSGRVRSLFPSDKVPIVRSLVGDPRGGVWLELLRGDLAFFDGRDLKTFTYPHDDKGDGHRMILTEDNTVLAATSYGLIGLRDGVKRVLDVEHGLPCLHLYATVPDHQGNLWIAAECGLIEVPVDQYRAWWSAPERHVAVRLLDSTDGVQPGLAPFAIAARSSDGRLWFANGSALEMVNPTHLASNLVPPPVHIEQLSADHRTYSTDDTVRLPARTRDIEIDYTALSLVAPEKVRFRYLLQGRDQHWVEAGRRRQAFYNDLAPGRYTFQVIASNNDDIWNRTGASQSFIIQPAFYQTNWFRAAAALVVICSLWLLYVMRLRSATAAVQARLGERLMERERIARELHDTLLQGFQGLLLRFHAVLKQLPNPHAAGPMLEAALDRADYVLQEARMQVGELRAEQDASELSAGLAEFGRSFTDSSATAFRLALKGTPRVLRPMIKLALIRIGRESIANAFLHAEARNIEAEVVYGRAALHLRISDDGKGIAPEIINSGVQGHWGLSNVREDARKIGAHLQIRNNEVAGATVQLTIGARYAYADSADADPWKRLKRWYVEQWKNRGNSGDE
jgi:signal transduction histidine kinase/ligand-binding sensor domain-containing protein